MKTYRFLLLTVSIAVAAFGQVERNPELKSRGVAWSPYDGSVLIDNSNRAEVFDLYWSVMRAPYESLVWSGSVSKREPGTTNEAWRRREYAQVNAYRALASLPPLAEDVTLLPGQQEGAYVMALNKRIEHRIDSSWQGYTEAAKQALGSSNLAKVFRLTMPAGGGFADAYMHDGFSDTPVFVGHRKSLLDLYGSHVAIGGATSDATYVALRVKYTITTEILNKEPIDAYVAYPGAGYFPKALFRPVPGFPADQTANFRWSFQLPADAGPDIDYTKVVIAATLDGAPLSLVNLLKNPANAQWTWEFAPGAIPETGDHTVEIKVTGAYIYHPVKNKSGVVNYQYKVHLFDVNENKPTNPDPKTPLVNISTRGTIGSGSNVMIAGFIVTGSLPVRVAIRAQGPALTRFGISNAAKRTRVKLFNSVGEVIGENAGWKTHPNWRMLESLGVSPAFDEEAGMVATLWPGSYTAMVSDDTGSNGIGIVEVFNIDNMSQTKLVNLSTRAFVGNGADALIAGFIVKDKPRTVVIRAQGPALAQFGIAQPASDPRLTIVSMANNQTVATNDDWATGANNRFLTDDTVNGYAPSHAKEAAVVLTLPPGAYTAMVESTAAGVGIVEVFDVGP